VHQANLFVHESSKKSSLLLKVSRCHLYGNPAELLSFCQIIKVWVFQKLTNLCTPFEKNEMKKKLWTNFCKEGKLRELKIWNGTTIWVWFLNLLVERNEIFWTTFWNFDILKCWYFEFWKELRWGKKKREIVDHF